MLVSYHRPYDAKLLFLAIPACAHLSTQKSRIAILGTTLTSAAIAFTSDIPIAILTVVTARLRVPDASLVEKISTILITRPAPIFLLALASFYLFACLRSTSEIRFDSPERSLC